MTPEQQAAFIQAQIALFNARVVALQADIAVGLSCGLDVSIHRSELEKHIRAHEGVLGWNAVIGYFTGR